MHCNRRGEYFHMPIPHLKNSLFRIHYGDYIPPCIKSCVEIKIVKRASLALLAMWGSWRDNAPQVWQTCRHPQITILHTLPATYNEGIWAEKSMVGASSRGVAHALVLLFCC
jgi:hypothetical protein